MNYLIKPLIQSITRNIRIGRKSSELSQHGTEASKVSTYQSKEWPETWGIPKPEPFVSEGLGSGLRTWACFSTVKGSIGLHSQFQGGLWTWSQSCFALWPTAGVRIRFIWHCHVQSNQSNQGSSQYPQSITKHAAHMVHGGMITSKSLHIWNTQKRQIYD